MIVGSLHTILYIMCTVQKAKKKQQKQTQHKVNNNKKQKISLLFPRAR